MMKVDIYTDGACIGNPGPGGYGAVLLYGNERKELSGGYRKTTNNRMEILAAIVGLEALKEKCQVTLNIWSMPSRKAGLGSGERTAGNVGRMQRR